MKEKKDRPKSPVVKEAAETASIQSNGSRAGAGLGTKKKVGDAASVPMSASPTESPTAPGTGSLPTERTSKEPQSQKGFVGQHEERPTLHVETRLDSKQNIADNRAKIATTKDAPTPKDVEQARNALANDDRSESATQALARVLSHHDTQVGDDSRKPRSLNIPAANEEAIDDSEPTTEALRSPSAPPPRKVTDVPESNSTSNGPNGNDQTSRPQLLRVGASHLPGYQPSRTSSTDGGDAASLSSSQVIAHRPGLEPSPNLNAALQRRRTEMRPPPRPSEPLEHVPTHLK